ncbi:MAG: hypothetical protein H6617_07765 [Bdellovibrionaceae bacterium]|nr:hypothetical protein [Bdellovibrionales bacterium]MCB9254563.1 hypothetical protein [Pseudobdellovibrionaceae bacterium]
MVDTIEINYEQLLKDYEQSLHEKLRNFGTAFDFLETWVPDENLEQSLLGIFEAAQLYKLKQGLRIRLSRNNSRLLKEVKLKAQAKEFGEARVEVQGLEKIVHFKAREEKRKSAPSDAVERPKQAVMDRLFTSPEPPKFGSHFPSRALSEAHGAYQKALRDTLGDGSHQGPLPENVQGTRLITRNSGSVCFLLVDKRGLIAQAKFESKGELETALMEAFCRLIEGLSLQEASDHGVLRLEYKLRDPEIPLGIPGIVTPENSDPMFRVPQALIRAAYAEYKKDHESGRNYWTDKISREWLSLSDAERLDQLRTATSQFCTLEGLAPDALRIASMQHETRVIVEAPLHSGALLRLETYLRQTLESQLEVLLAERQDTNKPRENNAKAKDLSS